MSYSPDDFPTHSQPVTCPTCRKTTYWPPSVAAKRRDCDADRFRKRPGGSLSLAILRKLGGVGTVAKMLKLGESRVYGWNQNGIPRRFHFHIIELATERGIKGIDLAVLEETVVEGREWRRQRRSNTVGRQQEGTKDDDQC